MIDFGKKLNQTPVTRVLDPVALYQTLDRASDKGPLRPAQSAVLTKWHSQHRDSPEAIVKLHTGQGKTLIGLLMLQSKLNQGTGPAVYLCPNNFLIDQTCVQAQQFGITVCTSPGELPSQFLDAEAILVTSVHKLFNGLTRFGIGARSLDVGSILMDDSHACVDAIRDAFTIRLPSDNEAYRRLRELFEPALKTQGAGTFIDICEKSYDAILPVPYWEWRDKEDEVIRIIASQANLDEVKFAWPLIRDLIPECLCVFSGASVEISPYFPPIEKFGSYTRAAHRIFMSATVTNDAFLVKGLRLKPATIRNPLAYEEESWSGEKMIIIPDLVHDDVSRADVIRLLAPPPASIRHFGIVALTPSGAKSLQWETAGAESVTKETISRHLKIYREKRFDKTLVITNRYDGIDLPDDMCRVLVLDSKPHTDNLADRMADGCRLNSAVMALRAARSIEQGIGRSVRGEKDYSVVILTGSDLVDNVRSQRSRNYLSDQTRLQIEIGLEIIDFAREELRKGEEPMELIKNLMLQCIGRDQLWKQFYKQRMDNLTVSPVNHLVLDQFQAELAAERAYQTGDWQKANQILQQFVDSTTLDKTEHGWYLQEMARYAAPYDKITSNALQRDAHLMNPLLLRPRNGMQVVKIKVSGERVENVISWIKQCSNYDELTLRVAELAERLVFGVAYDKFEAAIDELGAALGFDHDRPDKYWGAGPDNLWALEDGHYLLIECKNEVELRRQVIYKTETGQMNNSLAWFEKNYPGAKSTNWMIIPTSKLGNGAGFNRQVQVVRAKELKAILKATRAFFRSFQRLEFDSLSVEHVNELIQLHGLTIKDLVTNFSVPAF
jgi:replicative superfamily II helicase